MSREMQDPVEIASHRQRLAAGPETSVWVSASAGSGKTKVLTDRVLTLLLSGCKPERILCLTFTKAAAAEMANRLSGRLSDWAVKDAAELEEDLVNLLGRAPLAAERQRAGKLFARVLDTPGGMKIQTIHGFCQSLLARFPLEANLTPHFRVLDPRGASDLLAAARADTFARLLESQFYGGRDGQAQGPEAAGAAAGASAGASAGVAADSADPQRALAVLTHHSQENSFQELMAELMGERSRLQQIQHKAEPLAQTLARQRALLGLPAKGGGQASLLAACQAPQLDEVALRRIAAALAQGSADDRKRSDALCAWLALPADARLARLEDLLGTFLTAEGEVRKRLLTKAAQAADAGAFALAEKAALRCLDLRERRNAVLVAEVSGALLVLGLAILARYEAQKKARALVDYDDMVLLSRDLLRREGLASWVLYKLDGGLDHVLVDEAQDTNPEQWQVIEALTTDFFAGEGARDVLRTVFAVGDVKQSIYSFQRADPRAFLRMTRHFEERVRAAGQDWQRIGLDVSFRSTAAVLQAVDWTFEDAAARDGLGLMEEDLVHRATRADAPGEATLWPLVVEQGAEDPEAWALPLQAQAAVAPQVRLAQLLARQIWQWTLCPENPLQPDNWLAARGRRIRPGDILVLVRRRSDFVEALVRALKALGVPVAGADRMLLTEQIAVMDLIALGRFLLLPEDDLTLASLLKSPLFGLSEERLFTLAWRRRGSLFQALGEAAGDDADLAAIYERLTSLGQMARRMTPFAFFKDVLVAPWQGVSGRERLLARLGTDADDPLEEFLSLALAHEREQVPNLEGFLHQLETGAEEIKRDMEHGLDAVRIMTVHGAKGLQAPLVILPDSAQLPRKSNQLLWQDDLFLWPRKKSYHSAAVRELVAARQRLDAQEYRRLLYVAMTRAEDRLYVCGYGKTDKLPEGSWYALVKAGLEGRPGVTASETPAGPGGLRLESGRAAALQPETVEPEHLAALPALPQWALREPAPEPHPPKPLSPSRPQEADAPLPSPRQEQAGRAARQRGRLIHKLLETLPDLPPTAHREAALRLLQRPIYGLDSAAQEDILSATRAVLEDPQFAPIFAQGSRAEVPITGLLGKGEAAQVISGQVDRLQVAAEEVLIVDYKTNRPPPRRESDVAPLYLRQMAAYRAVLRQVYPEKAIRCALLWTEGPRLMVLSDARLDEALRSN